MTNLNPYAIISNVVSKTPSQHEWNLGVAQVVERYLGVVEAVGSSPATQTKIKESRQ